MPAVDVSRTIAARPAGLALILAGPTATELLADPSALGGAGVEVDVTPPRRSGVGFSATIRVLSQGRQVGVGSISLRPESVGTLVSVSLRPGRDVNAAGLGQWLRTGLDDLAKAARERSFAA
jgi:hypothetical protein